MKNTAAAVGLLAAAIVASAPSGAQTFQNGPYYANPSWDQKLLAAQRFVVLSNWGNEAVLDRETGLVWQRSPSGTSNWVGALRGCHDGAIGGRLGWRLPNIEELMSLADPSQTNPALPAGHPFRGIVFGGVGSNYWTSATDELDPTFAYGVNFTAAGASAVGPKNAADFFVWCVRGGSGAQTPQ
jgi:hypothetical protein